MKTNLSLAVALTLAALPLLNAAEGSSGLSIRTKALGSAAAEQRLQAVDAGDFITTPKGPRKLLRWSGAVVVSTEEANHEAAVGTATAKGGALEGYTTHAKLGKGLAILKGPAAEAEQHRKSPTALGQRIASARKAPGLRSANPVFIDSDSGLWCVTTTEIIIHLKPGVNAPDYFGADWDRVRALSGTTDHFILTLLTTEAEAVLSESRRHASDPRVQSSAPNFVMQVVQNSVPNDPTFASQWHLRNTGQGGGISNADVRATQAWDITTGSPNIVVAVIDDGVQTTHPDLLPNIATNALEIAGNSIDDDGNGYVDDVNGWNFYDGNNNPNPVAASDSHGTACAGVAVARGNNNTGIAGIAYTSRVMPVRLAGVGSVSVAAIVESIYYSAGRTKNGLGTWRGADVISISLGFSQFSFIDDALSWAATSGRGGKGCLVFVATGNNAMGWAIQTIGVPNGTYTFAFTYRKNASGSAGDDAAWLAEITFPNGTHERFNGATFPPAGWTTSGNANWTRHTGSDRAWGTSSNSARSGVITHNQTSTIQTTVTGPGDFEYIYWVSSEANADRLELSVLSGGSQVLGVTNSGVPTIEIPPSYPATHSDVMGVGASTDFDFRAAYSQYQTNIDFVAPSKGGVSGLTTTDRTGAAGANPGDYDANFGGTSAACPLAAGVAALALSVNTNLTFAEARAILRGTSDKIGGVGYTNGFNPYYGYGRVNAQKAVVAALGTVNDRCSNAIVITPLTGYSRTQSTVFAASALDQPTSCGFQNVKDVWYKVTVASPGLLSVTTSGSDFDTVLSTYSGSCGSLVGLQCNDDVIPGTFWSSNGVLVTAGTYYIQAAGYNGSSGTLVVRANFTPATLGTASVGVSNVHARTAILLGNVNPSYSAAAAWFEYGQNSSSFDFRTPSVISSNGQPFSFSHPIFDLTPGAIYYARVTVSNAVGISHSANQIFSAGDDRSVLDVAVAGDWVFGTSTNSPVGQTPPFAIDNTAVTKYLNFDKLNAGLTIAPSGNRIVRALSLISADDAPERDPSSVLIEASDDGVNFTRITSNAVPPFPTRHFIQSFSFENTNAYNLYRVRFPTVSNALTANSMQIAEVELLPDQEITSTNDAVSIQFVGPSLDVRGVRSLFDRQLDDIRKLEVQFFVGGGGLPVFVDTIPAAGATVVKGFQVIGAADDFTYPQRRPESVALFGSNDGTNYVQIASVVPAAPVANNQIQEFSCVANTNAWTKYRVVFGPPVAGDRLQVGEMRMFGEVVPAAPALAVRASGGNVLVSWPAASAGFNLEARTNFNTPGWLAVTNPPVLSNGLNTVTLPMSGAPIRFFQLRK